IHIHFPWGSLLRAGTEAKLQLLRGRRRLCAPEAVLEVIIGIDEERDAPERARLGIAPLNVAAIDRDLNSVYGNAGVELTERGDRLPADWTDLQAAWTKRLADNPRRSLIYIIARACETPPRQG